MIRLSLVGGTMVYHGKYFARMYNGCEPQLWAEHGAGGPPDGGRRIEEARIVKVWDEKPQDARMLARMCGVDEVCEEAADCGRGVDGILVADDCSCRHYRFAEPLWDAGLPMFIDKPLAGTIEEAEGVVAKARSHGVALFSASGLQYTREIEEARGAIEKLGPLLVALAASPGELVFYGIHGLAMLWSLYGPGIASVQNVGEEDVDVVKYRWRDGPLGVHFGLPTGRPGWRLVVFGEGGKLDIPISDADYFYWNLQRHFLDMVRTGEQPVPNGQMLEIIRALCLARESKTRGTGEAIPL
ncbi:MAG: Gfo/Idh/MocA family protein [Candidatus Brocadiia bacterium]